MESKNIEKEVDVIDLGKGIKSLIYGLSKGLLDFFIFIKRRALIISLIVVVAFGIGYTGDKLLQKFQSYVIVSANFESSDYLYNTINLLNSKVKQKDKNFFEKIGIKNYDNIVEIDVEPVIDVYHFISLNPQNFEMIKLLAEDGDASSTIKDLTTSKNYSAHQIKVVTDDDVVSKGVIQNILKYLNSNEYHDNLRIATIRNIDFRIESNKQMIAQIDKIVQEFSKSNEQSSKNVSDKLVYYNDNMQLNDIIATRNELVVQQGNLILDKAAFSQFIKEKSTTLNVRDNKSITSKLKIILPILALFIYILSNMVIVLANKYKQENAA